MLFRSQGLIRTVQLEGRKDVLVVLTKSEFGVGRDTEHGQEFVAVPVDAEVQTALAEMVQTTWESMEKTEGDPEKYEPSEKHASTEHLYLPLDNDLAAPIRELHQSAQLPIDASALADASSVFCYFARFADTKGRRLTAVRRASQFKGILRSKNRLVRMVDDTLQDHRRHRVQAG